MKDKFAGNAKGARICIASFAGLPISITGTFCGIYWGMWSEAQDVDAVLEGAYDSCGLVVPGDSGSVALMDTQWSTLLALNSILYLLLTIFTVFIVIGAWFSPLLCVGAIGHCLGSMTQFAAIIVTGVFRYSAEGTLCAAIPGNEHGEKIQGLFIAQCVLFCFYNCCISCMIQAGVASGIMSMGSKRM